MTDPPIVHVDLPDLAPVANMVNLGARSTGAAAADKRLVVFRGQQHGQHPR